MIQLFHGDCLDIMPKLDANSVDMVLADLPYGMTACKWDATIPLDRLFDQYRRVVKPNGAIVLFGSQPFTSVLVASNLSMFKYEWIYQKRVASNFAQAKRQPLKEHENVLVFCDGTPTYNPIKEPRKGSGAKRLASGYKSNPVTGEFNGHIKSNRTDVDYDDLKYPSSVQEFNNRDKDRGLHPTQKPVKLCEYLVRTHSNPGDTVLDNCMGSGTTGIACINAGRSFIGIEINDKYYWVARKRCKDACDGAGHDD